MGGTPVEGGDGIDERLLALLHENSVAGTPCVLATVVRCDAPTSAHPGDSAVITADGRLTGWIGGSCSDTLVRREALRALADGMPRLVRIVPSAAVAETRTPGELTVATTCPSGGALDVFVDPQRARPVLVVVGGSPAARALVGLGAVAGFRVCAIHPGAGPGDFPAADLVLPDLDVTAAGLGQDSWAIVATMGHYDEDAVEALLAHPDVDIALVASARRSAAVLEGVRARGVAADQLARVRAPAGGRRAGRQEDIALLALAEVVALRHERGAGGHGAGSTTTTTTAGIAAAPAPAEAFATDPVCGMVVDVARSAHALAHRGAVVHFCCGGCLDRFQANPDEYAAVRG